MENPTPKRRFKKEFNTKKRDSRSERKLKVDEIKENEMGISPWQNGKKKKEKKAKKKKRRKKYPQKKTR